MSQIFLILLEVGIDGVAPAVGAEDVDVLVLGDLDCLKESLSKVGKRGSGLGFHVAAGDGGEKAA